MLKQLPLQGALYLTNRFPRALPWASGSCPFGAHNATTDKSRALPWERENAANITQWDCFRGGNGCRIRGKNGKIEIWKMELRN